MEKSRLSTPSIRPLTAAYQASTSSNQVYAGVIQPCVLYNYAFQVVPINDGVPRKSSGLLSKAMEYMFGW